MDINLNSKTIQKVYRYDKYLIFNMKVSGYKDGTTFLVSINTDNDQIDDYYPLSNGDTKGLGSKVMEKDYEKQLEGKPAEGKLDTISGATITSAAVTNGIHEAGESVDDIQKGDQ